MKINLYHLKDKDNKQPTRKTVPFIPGTEVNSKRSNNIYIYISRPILYVHPVYVMKTKAGKNKGQVKHILEKENSHSNIYHLVNYCQDNQSCTRLILHYFRTYIIAKLITIMLNPSFGKTLPRPTINCCKKFLKNSIRSCKCI